MYTKHVIFAFNNCISKLIIMRGLTSEKTLTIARSSTERYLMNFLKSLMKFSFTGRKTLPPTLTSPTEPPPGNYNIFIFSIFLILKNICEYYDFVLGNSNI